MEHMTPKRLETMLSVRNNPSITGLVYSDSIELMNGRTTFCVCMVPLVYEGPVWWHVDIGAITVDIPAELSNDCIGIQGIHSEIKRVLRILSPKLHTSTVNRLRESGWLHTIG